MMSDVRGETYEEKLKDAGLVVLRERRIRGDMIEVFKVVNGIDRVEKEKWFSLVREEARMTRQNSVVTEEGRERRAQVLEREHFNLEVRRHFFNVRVVKTWNSLPELVKEATNVNCFKNRIDKHMGTHTLGESQ